MENIKQDFKYIEIKDNEIMDMLNIDDEKIMINIDDERSEKRWR